MNYCVVSGKICSDIDTDYNGNMSCSRFNIDNLYYKPIKQTKERTIIRCICYGSLADYVASELYEGANIIVTGRILNRHYVSNGVHIDRLYIGCNTVTRLEQEEYD